LVVAGDFEIAGKGRYIVHEGNENWFIDFGRSHDSYSQSLGSKTPPWQIPPLQFAI
jgi:hypothetical protein